MILLPVLPLAVLLGGVLLQVLFGQVLPRRGKGWLAFACALTALAAVLAMIPGIASAQALDTTAYTWDQNIPIQLHVDGLGLLFALMATGIGSAIMLYCIDYMAHEPEGVTRFYALMLTFIAGLVLLVFSANLLIAYLGWEIIGLCSYFLVGFWYKNPAAADGARKVLVMTHLPGYGLLIGILLLYSQTGTFLWTDPAIAAHFSLGIFLLMLAAAMAKSVMVPLHTWIPEAMNAPTPVSALLHSACYVKAGIYLIARMYAFSGGAGWPHQWNVIVMVIGCVTMLVGALFALAQTDLKRLLAFSTISQLGYIVAALGIGPLAGLYAAMFYTFSHGLFKGTLFLCSGAIQHAAGTRDMRKLGGLAAKMPNTTRAWLIAAAAIIGVPLTNGFFAKWLLFDTALREGQWAVVVIAWLVSIITAFYILKATVSVFYGDLPEALRAVEIKDAPASMQVGMGILAGLCLLFGIAPQLLSRWIVMPAAAALFTTQNPSLLPDLIRSTTQTPSLAAGGIVLAAVVLAGMVWGISRMGSSARTVSPFTGGDPLSKAENDGAEDFSNLAETALEPIYRFTDPDPIYLTIWRAVYGLAGRVTRAFEPLEQQPVLAAAILVVVLIASTWIIR